MTEQTAINLIQLQFVAISNPVKKNWLRPHIQEFKRQKAQVELGRQSHFHIASYLTAEIKKAKSIFFEQKQWLEMCLNLFKELENISTTNYAPVYLIILQIYMGCRFWAAGDLYFIAYNLLWDTMKRSMWGLDDIIKKYTLPLELIEIRERTGSCQHKWSKACLKYLDSLRKNPATLFEV